MAWLNQAKLSPSREEILDLASGDHFGPRSVAVLDDGLNYPGRDAHEFRTLLLEPRSTFDHLAGIRSHEQVGLRMTGR